MRIIIKPATSFINWFFIILVLSVSSSLFFACANQTTSEPPTISDPKISAPTPQEPGQQIGIAVDVSSVSGVSLTYDWQADGGEIVRGQNSPAITYRTPNEPGIYNVRVTVKWDTSSVEKVTTIRVEAPEVTPTPTSTPTPTPEPSATKIPANDWDAEVITTFATLQYEPDDDIASVGVLTLRKGEKFNIIATNPEKTWVFGHTPGLPFGWLPVERLKLNISLDEVKIR